MAAFFNRILNQNKIKYQTVYSARLDKHNEDNQQSDETILVINLNKNFNSTESDLDKIIVKFAWDKQVQRHEFKDCGWSFDKINSMTIYFCKTGELNGWS